MAHTYTKLRAQQSGSIAWRKRERMRTQNDALAIISQQVASAWEKVRSANDREQAFREKWEQAIKAEALKINSFSSSVNQYLQRNRPRS